MLDLLSVAVVTRSRSGRCRQNNILISRRDSAGGLSDVDMTAGCVVNVLRRNGWIHIEGLVHREQVAIRIITPRRVAIVRVVSLSSSVVLFAPVGSGSTRQVAEGIVRITLLVRPRVVGARIPG